MQRGQGLRHVQVVVHRRLEGLGDLEVVHVDREVVVRADAVDAGQRVGDEPVDALHRCACLREGLRAVVQLGTVVGLSQEVADHARGGELQHLGRGNGVADRLGHLFALVGDHAVVHPEVREVVARGHRLRHLVLVVREAQVKAAAVDVEGGAEVLGDHGGAFQVPARAAGSPGARPGGGLRVAGLVALPQGEVARVALAARVGVRGALHVVDVLVRQRAVGGEGAHVEVDVSGAVERRVGVAAFDQRTDQLVHLGDVPGGAGLVGRPAHTQGVVGGGELLLEAVGQREPGFVGEVVLVALEVLAEGSCGLLQDLVVDVRHVAHHCDLVAAVFQPAGEDVEGDGAAHVPHVRHALHRGTAVVQPDLALDQGDEVPGGCLLGVIKTDAHHPRLSEAAQIHRRSAGGDQRVTE